MASVTVRALRADDPADVAFLGRMFHEAVSWRPDRPRRPLSEVLASPEAARYVGGWGRPDDGGVIAEAAGERLGAAWWRLYPADDPGYGFVDQATPELGLAVVADRRREWIGRALLAAALDRAAAAGHPAVSLSVEPDNPARLLYQRLGFQRVGTVGGAWTMRRTLP
jgi:ribosomal protein S18 acetylase RimI-like enzyme